MEENKPSNTQAFPFTYPAEVNVELGMTLRDYFAAKAMQSLVVFYQDKFLIHQPALLAEEAYCMAERMLIEREKKMK